MIANLIISPAEAYILKYATIKYAVKQIKQSSMLGKENSIINMRNTHITVIDICSLNFFSFLLDRDFLALLPVCAGGGWCQCVSVRRQNFYSSRTAARLHRDCSHWQKYPCPMYMNIESLSDFQTYVPWTILFVFIGINSMTIKIIAFIVFSLRTLLYLLDYKNYRKRSQISFILNRAQI